MNKRQKKKKAKKEAWTVTYTEYLKQQKAELDELCFNHEGYRDTTAGIALRNLIRKGY